MELRVWDLWDDLSGDVTRGFAGDSIIWPHARWADPDDVHCGPAPFKLFVAECNASDPWQKRQGDTICAAGAGKKVSTLRNKASGSGQCVGTTGDTIADCGPKTSALLYYNVSASQLSLGALVPGVVGSARRCLDINHALGPNVDTYHCHPVYAGGGGERDFANQQFKILSAESDAAARSWKQLGSVSVGGQCLSLLNSFPPSPAAPKNVSWTQRLEKFARLLKSAGVNGVVLNDVNAYNSSEAEGANLLARAVAPQGGIVMWRAFVYGNGKIGTEVKIT